jgi:zinc and cadmium transporter
LVSFSAGVFLLSAGALALEVFEIFAATVWQGIFLILCGYGLASTIEFVFPESHHHHDPQNHDGHSHDKRGAKKLLIGDGIHNITDGIILVPAFLVAPALGLAVTASIFIHEALQEISEFFVLKQAGYSTKRALVLNFCVSCTIVIGVLLSYFALASQALEGALLAVAAGFFLHVVIHDLLPKPAHSETMRIFILHVLLVATGLVVMAGIATALSEAHDHLDSGTMPMNQ